MDLFKEAAKDPRTQPLAARMRPRNLDEFIGQGHIVGPGRLLRRAIQADQLSSLIFYGPPGTGKTTLAIVIANHTHGHFITLNAVLAGVAAIREAIDEAQRRRELYGQRTILFVDEVHRWNKAQQDALLPWVENGTIILVGATTENPYFEVNRALVSRSRIFQLLPLTEPEMRQVARAALADPERGYGEHTVVMDDDALDHLIKVSGGDARNLLNALELAVETTPAKYPPPPGVVIHIRREVAEESIQRRAVLYDKEGDYHFDTISAFIKSLRGSDPDAAVYWLAKMVYAGEDPRFLFRRMVIFAAEDIGLADPRAVMVAESNAAAFDRVGLPEGRFHLANTALYLATAPKSNSVFAFFDALKTVEQERDSDVPAHLRDSSRDAQGFGHGEGYLYPHSYRGHWVAQQYLPDSLQGRVFYQPTDVGEESRIGLVVTRNREAQLGAMLQAGEKPAEILTVSPPTSAQERWAERALAGQSREVAEIRQRLLGSIALRRHDRVLVLNADSGYLVWECMRRVPEGGIWALVGEPDGVGVVSGPPSPARPDAAADLARPMAMVGGLEALPGLLAGRGDGEVRFEAILGASALTRVEDRAAVLRTLAGLLAPGGRIGLAEAVPRESQRLSQLLAAEPDLARTLEQAEASVYGDPSDPRVTWGPADLERAARDAGLSSVTVETMDSPREVRLTSADLERWLGSEAPYGRALGEQRVPVRERLTALLTGEPVVFRRRICFLGAAKQTQS